MMKRFLNLMLLLLLLSTGATAAEIERFWVGSPTLEEHTRVTAALVYDGRLARIWLDVRDLDRVGSHVVARIARALDTATGSASRNPQHGIIENVQDVFGPSPSKYKVDGKDDFLLTDLANPVRGLMMLGSFQTKDQMPTRHARYSNQRNMLYIDSREGLRDLQGLLGTIAHEYQHLIHYGQNPNSERFFNEACSELAGILVGHPHSNSDYLANPNVPLMQWGPLDGNIEADYHRGMSLMLYLHEQFGDGFIGEFVRAREKGVDRIDAALKRAGYSSTTVESVLKDFALASYLQTDGRGAQGFRLRLDDKRAVADASFLVQASGEDRGGVTLAPYGSSFHRYDQPGIMRVRLPEGGAYSATAIVYDRGGVRTIDLQQRRETIIGDRDDRPEKVVLAFTSASAREQDIAWRVTMSGDKGSVAGTENALVSDVQILPNPFVSTGTIAFTTSVEGAVELALFDRSGTRRATIVDGVTVQPGRYRIRFSAGDLAPDLYLARLSIGGHSVTRQVMRVER